MRRVAEKDSVKVHYTGRLADGTVFDSSKEREPFGFTVGDGTLIPGFEEAVVGMAEGETKEARIASRDAYGEVRPDLFLELPRTSVPDDVPLEPGRMLRLKDAQGRKVAVTIARVGEDSVLLDANHPLAGQELVFTIEVVSIA